MLMGDLDRVERDTWLQALRLALPEANWLDAAQGPAAAAGVDAAVVANPPAGSLVGFPRLRLIQSLWAGVDRLLDDPTLPPGVPIARMVDPAMNAAMAEITLWATLALHRGAFRYARQQRRPAINFKPLNDFQIPINQAAEMVTLGLLALAWRRRDRTTTGLALVVALGIMGNAFVCGSLSNPHDRYQNRVVWLALFTATIGAVRLDQRFAGRGKPLQSS